MGHFGIKQSLDLFIRGELSGMTNKYRKSRVWLDEVIFRTQRRLFKVNPKCEDEINIKGAQLQMFSDLKESRN